MERARRQRFLLKKEKILKNVRKKKKKRKEWLPIIKNTKLYPLQARHKSILV